MSTKTAVIIGEESLLLQCADTLLEQGVAVLAVATNAVDIADWAASADIPTVPNNTDLAGSLAPYHFDYLFSITNLRIVPDEVLSMAGSMAINFHDGPLPSYAGLHATSWALLNGEASHGVTWHIMEPGIDKGDLLKQVLFDVAEDETAYTLNVKCYENAIGSFEALVGELLAGSETKQPQDFTNRSYFAKYKRPNAAATIDWSQQATSIEALVRSLDFGPHENPLGCAKVLIGDQLYVVPGASAIEGDNIAQPGTILSIDGGTASVATADGAIAIENLIDRNQATSDAAAVLASAGLAVGARLPLLDSRTAENLTTVDEQLSRNEAHWVRQLIALESVELPYPRRPHEVEQPKIEKVSLVLPDSVNTYLDANAPGAARSAFLVSAFACYLSRLTGMSGFHLGAGATLPDGMEDTAAWVMPEVPLRFDVVDDVPIADAVRDLSATIDAAEGRLAISCDVGLRHPELKDRELGWSGLPLPIAVETRTELSEIVPQVGADLVLAVSRTTGQCGWIRNESAYPSDVFVEIEHQFLSFLEQIVTDDRRIVSDLSLLSPEVYRRVVEEWNATAKTVDLDVTIHELFSRQASASGSAPAIVHENESLSYEELDGRSDQLARHLGSLGVGHGACVGIRMDRGLGMIVSLLGVLKAGAAYIPLDPTYPADRIEFMIEDSAIATLLTQSTMMGDLPDYQGKRVAIDGDWEQIATQPRGSLEVPSGPDDLAYLIYTSGSTGKPKGVMVTHRNVINFLAGMDDHIEHEDGDTWLTVTSLSFDISVLEIFWSLTHGLELVIFADSTERAGQDAESLLAADPSMQRDIGFSLFYFASDESEPGSGNKYDLLLEGARFADQNGFEAVWTPERHFFAFGGLYPNPSVTSGAIAAITENVHIRAGSCVLPLHHPVRVAEEWSVVDNISNGRVGIAFAAGWQPVDFVLRPENFADRKGAVTRDVETVRRLWRGETLSMDGPNGPVDVRTLPRPVQPELPTWLTIAGNPETFAEAGASGFNVLTHLLGQTVDEVQEKIEIYRNARREAGHEGDGHVTLMLHTYVGDDLEAVRDLVREPMIEYLRSSVMLIKEAAWSFPTFQQRSAETGKSPMDLFDDDELTEDEMDALLEHAFNRYFESSALFGTPDTCRSMVNDLRRIGVDEIACQVDFGLPTDVVLDRLPMLNALRESVIPVPAAASAMSAADGSSGGGGEEDFSIPALIERHNVSHFQCTPSMGSMLIADDHFRSAAARLKMCLMGGEAFPQTLAKEITDVVDGTVLNVYGPTETTIWSSVYQVENGDRPVSIGRPLANQQMYVVDSNLQPCPIGVPGELLIGGDGVTNGYLGRPELNEERFVPDRFRPDHPDARLYRTGDLVRFDPDGSIDFLGRMDFQVKIRGYRIELGEIEARLNEHPSIREAVVIAREDNPGDQRLVAYAIPDSSQGIDGAALREHLGQHLPEFMVPVHYVELSRFPLTPNNKTDRKALPPPDEPRVSSSAEYVAPESDTQQQLAELWQDLLGVSQVGVNDNFFDLGGHSLLAVQLHRRINRLLSADISITDVFRFPTVASLTAHLDNQAEQSEAAKNRSTDRAEARREAIAKRRAKQRR